MSLPCSSETCKRTSSVSCSTCKKNLCNEHLKEHNDQLNFQLNPLTDEIKSLSNRYKSLDTNKFLNDCHQQLDKWRNDCHKTIDRLYKQKCEELNQNWSRKLIKTQKDLNQIQLKMNQFIKKQKTTHEDINQSIEALRYINQEIKDIDEKGLTIDIHPLLIDENLIFIKESKFQDINVFDLSSSYRTINCSGQSGVAFAKNDRNLLVYEYHKLNLFNQNLISIQQTLWTDGQIYDICWSITLNHFISITDKGIVYLINENSLTFKPIKSIQQEKWWSLTCSDKYLFVTTYGTDANIFQFDLLSSFYFIKRWRSPQTCQQHEFIHDINYTNDTLLLIIGDSSNKTARIELRSSIKLTRYWAISIDINSISYQPTIHSCLLKHNQWIIIVEDTSNIIHISKDGKLNTIYEYQQPVWNAILVNPNLLAIRTEHNINFHQI